MLVNGALTPHHYVHAHRYRLRVLNASHFRAYNLRLTGGVRMVQITFIPKLTRVHKSGGGPAEARDAVAS